MPRPVELALVYRSDRPGRLCDRVAAWAVGEIWGRPEFRLSLVESMGEGAARRLDHAEACLLLVEGEEASGLAPLLRGPSWQDRPVALLGPGGAALRQRLALLRAVVVPERLVLPDAANLTEDGWLRHPGDLPARFAALLDRLHWWALVLRQARAATAQGRAA
ncbi:hypothetical protein [Pseudoroseomonas cervicalis]|uniref:hypothetical protein n=1 Tax=Teichococcus cervicalis TaxID=204525 RepID=UPI002783CF27|nr:hypothetical protein [Pseudoroseomonas cervicalis]MDQ1080850.1 hypothetical protein [Pseudoroseomonas cervicalis]